MAENRKTEAAFDPHRKLCPDGSCLGVIGEDGRCTVCGIGTSAESHAEAWQESPPTRDYDSEPAESEETSTAFDPNRRLCGDGSCIGVIGTDGRCTVCGKPLDS